MVEDKVDDDEFEPCFNFVISNKSSRCDGGGYAVIEVVEGPPSPFFFFVVKDASNKSGGGLSDDRGREPGEGGMPTGALPGDGNGEFRDFNDC